MLNRPNRPPDRMITFGATWEAHSVGGGMGASLEGDYTRPQDPRAILNLWDETQYIGATWGSVDLPSRHHFAYAGEAWQYVKAWAEARQAAVPGSRIVWPMWAPGGNLL